jgi:hypothetical protein
MGRNDADRSAVDRNVDVQSTPGFTRRDVQVNTPHCQDGQA